MADIENMPASEAADAICPTCKKLVEGHRCRLCGATKTINQVSGNLIWMRNGRLVAAFHDEKEAWLEMATQYGIPRDQWPEKFKELKPKLVSNQVQSEEVQHGD